MSESAVPQGKTGSSSPVFIRLISSTDRRATSLQAAGYFGILPHDFIAVPYEVVHAPGFGMWAMPSMRRHLEKLLRRPSVLTKEFLKAPGSTFSDGQAQYHDHWMDQFPEELRKEFRQERGLTDADMACRVAVLTPDNKLLGLTAFAPFFSTTVALARARQPSSTRLALLVGLVATAFEEPDRSWPSRRQIREKYGVEVDESLPEEGLTRVLPGRERIRKEHADGEIALGETILRIAMLRALPPVLDSLPDVAGTSVVTEACTRLLDWVTENLWPASDARDHAPGKAGPIATVDGRRVVFTRELLSYPRTLQESLFRRVVDADDSTNAPSKLYRDLARAFLTPDQMCAVLMKLWGDEPLDAADGARLRTHFSRARGRITALRDPGGL